MVDRRFYFDIHGGDNKLQKKTTLHENNYEILQSFDPCIVLVLSSEWSKFLSKK